MKNETSRIIVYIDFYETFQNFVTVNAVIIIKYRNIYSQTCIKQPLLGPLESGCLGQLVIL